MAYVKSWVKVLREDPATATAVLHIFLRALETELRRVSPGAGPKARFGAVSFLHRFGGAINANFLCEASHKKLCGGSRYVIRTACLVGIYL